jgi:hypothetical protein
MGMHNRSFERGDIIGMESGCLCDLKPMWTHQKKWMHGFINVWFKKDSDYFYPEQVKILDGSFIWGGQLWEPAV